MKVHSFVITKARVTQGAELICAGITNARGSSGAARGLLNVDR
jgi:hypothetical protein